MGNLAAPLNTLRTASLEPLSRAANRILVVEDDPAVQKALRRLFETEGYAVETQSDGKSALDSFRASAPAAIVLDLRLPKVSGRDVCKEIKSIAPGLPVVVLTAQEFKTFQFLVQNADRVISRDELLNEVWGYQNYPSTRTVDNHILKLRQKLEKDPSSPIHFRTVHGMGYKFVR